MATEDLNDRELEQLFASARKTVDGPSEALLARVIADATEVAKAREEAAPEWPAPGAVAWLREIWLGLGGWPAGAGLVAATLAGVWLGFSPPAPLEELAEGVLMADAGLYLDELMPSLDVGFGGDG